MPKSDYRFSLKEVEKEICSILGKSCKKILPLLEERLKYKSKFTQIAYTRVLKELARRLKQKEDPRTKEVFLGIVDPKGKYRLQTRLQRYYALKFIFETFGWEVPVFIEEIRKGEKILPKRNTLSNEQIRKLINFFYSIKDEVFCYGSWCCPGIYITGVGILSTIYGLRRGEIYAFRKNDYSKEDSTFLVKSQKGSVIRHHLLFDEVKPLFEEFVENIYHPPDRRYLNTMLRIALSRAEIRPKYRRNFHAIRKSIATMLLMNNCNPVYVNDFLRWKGGGTMLSFYANLDPIYIDKEVSKYHDYLKMWKEVIEPKT